MVVSPVQSQWTSTQFLLFCTLPTKSGKKIYFMEGWWFMHNTIQKKHHIYTDYSNLFILQFQELLQILWEMCCFNSRYKKTPYLYRLFQFIYLRVPGVASNIMRNALFQFTGILLTSNVFKLFTHESMVGFLHFKVSYPTTHFINSHMPYRIQNLFFPSKNKINCLWSKGLYSRFTKSRQIQWYTFIHLYIFTIEKSQNLLASRTGNPGQSHT